MTSLLDLFLVLAEILMYPIRVWRRRRHLMATVPQSLRETAISARDAARGQNQTPSDVLTSILLEDRHLRTVVREFAVLHIYQAYVVLFRRVELGSRWPDLSRRAAFDLGEARGDPAEARRIFLRRLQEDAELDGQLVRWGAERVLASLPRR
jgi:hypothetical protein